MKTGRIDINGVEISVDDIVHCWDGSKDQREVTASLRGVVSVNPEKEGCPFLVGGYWLALSNSEHVEIIN